MWDGGVRYLDGRQKPPWVVAKVEWHPGELCPRVGFIVANLARAEHIVGFSNVMLMIPTHWE
jgi:hypothetical protein